MKYARFLIPAVITMTTITGFMACSKSNSGTRPKIVITSVNSQIQPGQNLDVKFKFTSNGGTLSNGTFVSIRIRTNGNVAPQTPGADTIATTVPTFPDASQGEFEYQQPYDGYLHYVDHINDSLTFKFAVINTAGVSSDTISTKVVVINP